ncbi:MAG: hypothetical protein RMM08_00930 [Armatimonadota bacterium]|nr:hypothetical protein [bacterium]MDW8319898.1 hypothetical protein [Armatimonadota bacterium]
MKSRVPLIISIIVLATVAVLVNLRTCSGTSEGLSQKQVQQANRLHEIARRTGGDWSKLSPEERRFLVNELAYGNEQSARMLLWGASRQAPAAQPAGRLGR